MSRSNSSLNIQFCVEAKIQGKPWKITKILHGPNSRLGGFFQEAVSTPGKTANPPKYLYLVSRIVVLNPDMEISAGLSISTKYQHSQNRQNRPVNTRKQQNTRAHHFLGFPFLNPKVMAPGIKYYRNLVKTLREIMREKLIHVKKGAGSQGNSKFGFD